MLLVGISHSIEKMGRDGWRGWLSVAAVSFSGTVFCTTEFLPVGLIRYVSADLGVPEGTTGLMVTAPGLMAAIAGPVVALFSGKTDRRAIMLLLSLLLICANVVAAFATRFEIVVVARMLFGIGLGGFWAIGTGIASRLVAPAAVGKATSVIFTSISIGLLVGGPAGTFVSEIVGWRYAFGLTAIVSVLSFFTLMFSLPPLKVSRSVSVGDFLAILKSRNGKVGIVAMFLVVTGHFCAYVMAP
jgi:predicted MFS family arabinose efflux permease